MSSDLNENKLDSVKEDINSEIQSNKGQIPSTQILKDSENLNEILNEDNNGNEEKENNDDNNFEKEKIYSKSETNITEIKNENNNENNYLNTVNKLKKEIEEEKINHLENIKQLKNKLNYQNKNVKNVSLKNSNLRSSLQDLNYEMDKILKKSTSSRISLLEQKVNPEKNLEILKDEIKNSLNLENIFLKDNKRIKKLIEYQIKSSVIELDSKINAKLIENQKLKKEIYQLNFYLKNHLKCDNEKEELKRKIKNIELDIIRQQEQSKKIKLRFDNLDNINNKSILAFIQYKENIKLRKQNEEKKKSKSSFNNSKMFNHILLENIDKLKEEITTITKDEIDIMEKYYNDNLEQFETFLKNIYNIEKYLKRRENEINDFEKENEEYYNSKKEQLNILKTNLKLKEDKIQNYEIQIEDYKNSKITLETKLNHITNSLNKTKNKIKKKEKLNSDLFSEINNLKKLLKENNYNPSNKSLMDKIITKETGTNYDYEEENEVK